MWATRYTPKQCLEYQVEALVAKGLMRYGQVDRFRSNPPSEPFLLVPPIPREPDLNHYALEAHRFRDYPSEGGGLKTD